MLPTGETIQLWRGHKRLTQAVLADRAGISRPNLSAIEQGARDMTIQTLRRIAGALEITPGTLVDGLGPTQPTPKEHYDRFAIDRIARLAAGQSIKASAQERKLAMSLASLMKSKVNYSNVKPERLRSVRAENRTLLNLKSVLGQGLLDHLIRRVEKNL